MEMWAFPQVTGRFLTIFTMTDDHVVLTLLCELLYLPHKPFYGKEKANSVIDASMQG